jgi:hypothetical protein
MMALSRSNMVKARSVLNHWLRLGLLQRGRLVNPRVEGEINPHFNLGSDDGRALWPDHRGHDY